MKLKISLLPLNAKPFRAAKESNCIDILAFCNLISKNQVLEIALHDSNIVQKLDVNPRNVQFALTDWVSCRRKLALEAEIANDWVITGSEDWEIQKYLATLDQIDEFVESNFCLAECIPAKAEFTISNCVGHPRWMAWAEINAMCQAFELVPKRLRRGEIVFLNPYIEKFKNARPHLVLAAIFAYGEGRRQRTKSQSAK